MKVTILDMVYYVIKRVKSGNWIVKLSDVMKEKNEKH
jgi:hypothetical protein